eukprot:555816_1
MSIFGIKDLHDGSGIVTFRNHATNHYLSIDRSGTVSTIRLSPDKISKNETLSLALNRNYKNPNKDDKSFYIRSYYGHYLTFDMNDYKLYCQKISHSITSWYKHTSQLYARFSSNDLYYFTPASTAGIIGASGISIYGNKYLSVDGNGTVSNKLIPGKHEMWILKYVQKNVINVSPNTSDASLKSNVSNKSNSQSVSQQSMNDEMKENDEKTMIDTAHSAQTNFEEKLFVVSNLVQSNNKALDIYKEQIKNKTIKVNTMSDWDKLYKRILMKQNQWNSHKTDLEINDINNNIIKSLDNKYYEKYSELEETKEIMIDEQRILNELNKSKDMTNIMFKKCKEEINEYDKQINELQNKINELNDKKMKCLNKMNNEIKPKLNNECEGVINQMGKVNKLNTKTSNFEKELTEIKEIKFEINKFENDIKFIINYLETKFKNEFETTWMNWSVNDVIIWLGFLNNVFKDNNEFKFKNENNKQLLMGGIKASNLCGKDLKNINDLILRSFDIKEEDDRKMILKCLNTLMSQMDNENDDIETKNNDDIDEETQDRQCVVCMDNTANMMFMPCNHIAICQQCYNCNTFHKCAFCGNKCNKVIKCYNVGF